MIQGFGLKVSGLGFRAFISSCDPPKIDLSPHCNQGSGPRYE